LLVAKNIISRFIRILDIERVLISFPAIFGLF